MVHAFRTSATLLADTGVDVLALKRHAGWKSSTITEGYVENTEGNKIQFARHILQERISKRTGISNSHSDFVGVADPLVTVKNKPTITFSELGMA